MERRRCQPPPARIRPRRTKVVDGITFHSHRIGDHDYCWTSAGGFITVMRNPGRKTFNAHVNGACLGALYRTDGAALDAAVAHYHAARA